MLPTLGKPYPKAYDAVKTGNSQESGRMLQFEEILCHCFDFGVANQFPSPEITGRGNIDVQGLEEARHRVQPCEMMVPVVSEDMQRSVQKGHKFEIISADVARYQLLYWQLGHLSKDSRT